jgi:hypothetical protein
MVFALKIAQVEEGKHFLTAAVAGHLIIFLASCDEFLFSYLLKCGNNLCS